MRIRGRKPAADCSVSPSPSSSSTSPSSSYSSLVTAANSAVSSPPNSCPFSLLATASHRCHGLNLLVKAIHQVTAGSVIGVPYIQRRVTIRRRRRLDLEIDPFMLDELSDRKRERSGKKVSEIDKSEGNKKKKKTTMKKKKQGKNLIGLSSGIQDSILQPWARRSDLAGEMAL